jgi:small-conductance mechanosensitive channel
MLIPVEVSDTTSPHEVREAMLTVAQRHPLVFDEPKPDVFYISTVIQAANTNWPSGTKIR